MSADEFLQTRSIDCDGLPQYVKDKAQTIITAIETGTHFTKLHGKRMIYNQSIISIPVNYSYRLLATEISGDLIVEKLVSHETYNKLLRRR